MVTGGGLYPRMYFAYLVVADGDSAAGVAGVQCGIQYDAAHRQGVDIYSWANCGALEFPTPGWPAAGTGDLIKWDASTNCQRPVPGGAGSGVKAVAGYFYCAAYGPDTLSVIARPADNVAGVVSCQAVADTIARTLRPGFSPALGQAVFSLAGIAPGYSPCGINLVGDSRDDSPAPGEAPATEDPSDVLSNQPRLPDTPDASFPFEIVIAADNGLALEDQLFTEGDRLTLTYDSDSGELRINAIHLWGTYRAPGRMDLPRMPALASRLDELYQASVAGDDSTRILSAIQALGPAALDPHFTPKIAAPGVWIQFAGETHPVNILLLKDAGPHRQTPRQAFSAALTAARHLEQQLERPHAPFFVYREGPKEAAYLGNAALEALDLCRRAVRGGPLGSAWSEGVERLSLGGIVTRLTHPPGIPR